jgi:hypothetical protein
MFTLLRSVAIIGLIFYFSPARDLGQTERQKGGEERRPEPRPSPLSEAHESPWNRLVGGLKEEAVRTAMNEKTLSAGLRLKDGAARLLEAPAVLAPPERPRSPDVEWALREAYDPSVRCVYRCDGTE